MSRGKNRLSAFTLVELLVVIAIIGVLVALLLPAVQQARESGRQTQCKNNLKQIALALHNYHDSMRILPPGIQFDQYESGTTPTDPTRTDKLRPNWIISILPFMEQNTIYESFNFNVPISDPLNRDARGRTISSLICPSDAFANKGAFRGTTAGEGDNWARGCYSSNGASGLLTDLSGGGWSSHTRRGVMGMNVGMRFAEITDGLSRTIMVGEVRTGLNSDDRRGSWALGTAGGSALFGHGCLGDANGPNVCNDRSDDIEGCDLLRSDTNIGVTRMAKECMTCWKDCPSYQSTVRSLHMTGVYVAYCDGSVQLIRRTIETSGEFGPCANPTASPPIPTALWDALICSQDEDPRDYAP